jgi:hypothetical protein
MTNRRLLAVVLMAIALAGSAAYAQQFPLRGDDITSSLGSFRVNIATEFQPLFANCPIYNRNTNVLQSPTLNDPGTIIGRSDPITDGSVGNNSDVGGVFVGSANTLVSEGMLIPPPHFSFGAGTREVHTEVRSLHMTGPGNAAVRAGVWYNSATATSTPPARISPGEVESRSGPHGLPQNDFPASSFFDVFVQVDIPACGNFPGATLYNIMPLIVKNTNLLGFPPKVSYLHDASSIVPILFLNADTANPPRWQADDILGYFLLAGHGVGVAQSDFETFMAGQPDATCPYVPPIPQPSPTPSPSPSPTPVPSPTPTPSPSPTKTVAPTASRAPSPRK